MTTIIKSAKAPARDLNPAIPLSPRKLDPAATFGALVQWVHDQSLLEKAPGLIMGISGTDSILTYLACAKAFARMGKPGRVLGVHFSGGAAKSGWVVNDIFPWLQSQAPGAALEVDEAADGSDDQIRWGRLFSRAVRDTGKAASLASNYYFTAGTRNATEEHLGTYSQLSSAVSMMPIINLFKSEVLDVCAWLGAPDVAMRKSCEIDCDCGRFQVAADYLREVDLIVMQRKGLLSRSYIEQNIPPDVRATVLEYVMEEESRNKFRKRTPYMPAESLVVVKE
jgi:NH3-dependent NAD+ synthetase